MMGEEEDSNYVIWLGWNRSVGSKYGYLFQWNCDSITNPLISWIG